MDIKLYKFKKRTNSTKQPSPDSANTFACTVDEDCSINNPTVRIKAPDTLIDLVTKTISNQNHIQIIDGAGGQPCPEVFCSIVPSQGGTGLPSPSNVRPIYGYDLARIIQTAGANVKEYRVELGRTVYGGTIDFVSGQGAENKKLVTFDGTENGWSYQQNSDGTKARAYIVISGATGGDDRTINSNYLDTTTGAPSYPAEWTGYINRNNGLLMVGLPTTITSKQDWINYLADHPLQVLYPLATPQTYQLTPQVITTFQGLNNLDVNTGSFLTFTYKAYEPSSSMKIYDLNYAYIPAWHRYYFVSQLIYELGTWVFVLRCDVMATRKYEIGESDHYIERCSYEFDGDIIDGLYPEKTDPELVIAYPTELAPGVYPCIFDDPNTVNPGIEPSYIVGIIGGIAQENVGAIGSCYNGSVVYFAMAQDQLGDFIASLLNSVNLYAIDPNEISYDLQKQLINPIQYIESIKCVPFMPSATSDYVAKQYYLGFQYLDVPYAYGAVDPKTNTNRSWKICKAPTIGDTTNKDNGYLEYKQNMMKLPLHPEMDSRGHWVLSSPISKYVFTCEPFGQIEIPSGNIMHAPITTPQSGDPYIGLWYSICFDISTGDCTLFLSWDTDIKEAFIKVTKNCCIPVPVHQSVQDVMTFRQDMRALGFQAIEGAFGLVKSSVNAVGGTSEVSNSQTLTASKTEYDISGPIGSAINTMDKMMKTIDDATMANQVKISGNSANGSYMSFNKDLCTPRVFCYFTPLAEEHNEERGKPLCAVRKIKDIPGYIVCSGAEIETYGTAEENNAIASFLNGGFYYE